METPQKRIGIILCITASIVFVGRLIGQLRTGIDLNIILISTISIGIMAMFYIITFLKEHILCKIFQVVTILAVGLLSYIDYFNSPHSFFFIVIAIVLMFVYGWFKKYRVIKIIFTFTFMYAFIVIFTFNDNVNKWYNGFAIIVIISLFLFILWVIVKDYITAFEKDIKGEIKKLDDRLKTYKTNIDQHNATMGGLLKLSEGAIKISKELASRGDNG